MKIAFINPALGGDFSAIDIAITVLASCCNARTDHRASIIDLTFHRRNWKAWLRKKLLEQEPGAIGISVNTLYLHWVKLCMGEAKKLLPHVPIILGGYHASISAGETIAIPEADIVIAGDAETRLPAVLDRLSGGLDLGDIAGIRVKRADGSIYATGAGTFTEDFSALPAPDYDLWEDLDKYFYFLGMLYVNGTRGCPYTCSFCDAHGITGHVAGRYYRPCDPVRYARQLSDYWNRYKHRGLRLFQMFDQVFTMNAAWLKAFTDEYIRLGLHRAIGFSAFSRIDHLDDGKLAMLAAAGCRLLRVGIESGNDYIRNEVLRKNLSSDRIRSIVRKAHALGIHFTAFYIIGAPGETGATINETIRFARDIDAGRSAFFIYKPFTEEGRRQIEEFGGSIDEKRWRRADNITFDAVVRLRGVSPRRIEWYQKKAYFFTFGKRLLRMLRAKGLRYFFELALYLVRGMYYGLSPGYLMVYYHIYGYDNVDR
jgi:radical SAM superfamily enzyme YgiQ (UPF0313 family)